jgi:hypothetical protein
MNRKVQAFGTDQILHDPLGTAGEAVQLASFLEGVLPSTGEVIATQFKLSALNTAPTSATDTGTTGEIRIDADHIYVCVATDVWERVAIATWV